MLCGMCMCACVCVWFVNLALVHLNSSSSSLSSSFHSKITRLTRSLIIISLHSVSMETYSRKRSSDGNSSSTLFFVACKNHKNFYENYFAHMEVRKTVKTVLLTESEVKITLFLGIKFMLRHFYIPN